MSSGLSDDTVSRFLMVSKMLGKSGLRRLGGAVGAAGDGGCGWVR